jgi:hypothetical protein
LGIVVATGLAGVLYPWARCELGRPYGYSGDSCSHEQAALVSFCQETGRVLAGILLGASYIR